MNEDGKRRDDIVNEWRDRYRELMKVVGKLELKSVWSRFFSRTPNSGFAETQEFKDALAFYRAFECKPDVNYEHLVAYARECLDRCEKTDRSHDDKANSIIQYLGGGTALGVFAAVRVHCSGHQFDRDSRG
jgi:hypothetical protein